MSNLLRVFLYNTESESSAPLQEALRGLNFVRLMDEIGSPERLANRLREGDVNLVFFHLDPDADAVVEVIDQVSNRYPDVAMIAVSHKTDPESILAPMRAGCDQFVCEPIDPKDLATAVGRVASKRLLTQPRSRCICVTGASGGAGATSIACNLALEIGDLTERDCALLDVDVQYGDVAMNFDCEPRYTLYDVAVAGDELDETVLASIVNRLPCRVGILSRPNSVEQCELITPECVHRAVELLTHTYENLVLDVPRDFSPITAAAFSRADMILVICQLLVPSIRNARRLRDALLQLGVAEDRIQYIVNRNDGRGNGRVTIPDLEETVKKKVYATVPNDYQFVARSIDFGRPIASLDRNSPVRSAIRTMAQQLTVEARTAGKDKGKKGFFSRLLTK